MVAARLAAIDALRSEPARDPPPHRPDEILPPPLGTGAFLAREIDSFQFGIAPRHESRRRAAGRARDVHALDIPVARRHGDGTGDRAAIGQNCGQARLRPRIAVEGGEEAAFFVKDQVLIVQFRRNRAAGGGTANPATLGQFTVESEYGRAGRDRGGRRNGSGRRCRLNTNRLDRLGHRPCHRRRAIGGDASGQREQRQAKQRREAKPHESAR